MKTTKMLSTPRRTTLLTSLSLFKVLLKLARPISHTSVSLVKLRLVATSKLALSTTPDLVSLPVRLIKATLPTSLSCD